MDTSQDVTRTGEDSPVKNGGRLRSLAIVVIFDVAGPLAAYGLLRSAGMTAVAALLLSGAFPVLGVTIGAIGNHRLDIVGALVLAGIVVGTVLGLVSHSARLLLVEGSLATATFGVACLGSLRARQPLIFGLVLEFTGPDTAKGREMIRLWQYDGYRQVFRIITAVWGAGFIIEAAVRVVVVYNTSTGTALAASKVMPFIWGAILSAWTVVYGAGRKRKGERLAAATSEVPGASRTQQRTI